MADSLEHILACQVCLEDLEETGDHVPRIMPCSHTLCERCLKQLIKPSNQGDKIDCPECRTTHAVVDGVKTFPQNKYILTNIRRKHQTGNDFENDKSEDKIAKCPEHGKDIILYCKRLNCQKPICQVCITKYHRGHDVVDIDEVKKETKEILLSKIKLAKEDLQRKRSKISAAHTETKSKTEICISSLQAKKEEILTQVSQRFDDMITQAELLKLSIQVENSKELKTVDEVEELLDNIGIEQIADNEAVGYEELTRNIDTVNEITGRVAIGLSGTKKYPFLEYNENKSRNPDEVQLFGVLTAKEDTVELGPTVTTTIRTNLSGSYSIALLQDDTAVILGDEHDVKRLRQYTIPNGQEVCVVDVNDNLAEITEIKLAGKVCLAISYRDEKRIDFHDSSNLHKVILTHTVGSHPYILCALTTSSLLYADRDVQSVEVKRLDCSMSPPKLIEERYFLAEQHLNDMCPVHLENNKDLVVTTHAQINEEEFFICAHDPDRKTKEWSVIETLVQMPLCPQGLTTDGKGQLYICDPNNACIQMFSSGGEYRGVLLRQGEQGLGTPWSVRWCNSKSLLVVLHKTSERDLLSFVKV